MGVLFDDTVVYTASASAKLVHGENDPARDAVLEAVLNNTAISGSITAQTIVGTGGRIRPFESYARSTYFDGLPELLLYAEYGRTGMLGEPVPILVPSYISGAGTKELELYPIVALKTNTAYVNDESNKETVEYKTTNRLLRKVGLNVNSLCELIQTNPDDAAVDDAFFMFGLDIFTEVEISKGYLYEFFLSVGNISPVTKEGFEASIEQIDGPDGPLYNVLEINEGQYTARITWDYAEVETMPGIMPGGGEYGTEFTELGTRTRYDADWGNGGTGTAVYYVYDNILHFRSQETKEAYTEVRIHGFVHEVIIDAFGERQDKQKYPTDEFVGLEPTDLKAGTSGLYIPLSPDLLPKWKSLDRTKILNDAMIVVLHSASEVELEWYQLGIVKAIIVGVSFYAAGIAIGNFVAASAAAAAAGGGISLGSVGLLVAKVVAMNFIVELIIENVGGPIGVLIATAAAIAIGRIDLTGMPAFAFAMPTASELLVGANALTFATNKYNQLELEQLVKQYNIYEEDNDKALTELKALQDELPDIDEELRAAVLRYTLNPDQDAKSFYDRVYSGTDSIVISYKVVENFVDNALALPTQPFTA